MTSERPAAYFESTWAAFASVSGEPWQTTHRVGGRTVRIEGKGSALASALLPALAHLACNTSAADATPTPDLVVRTWDLSSGRIGPPPLDAAPGDQLVHDRVAALSDERFVVIWERHFDAITLVDRATGRAVYFTGDAAVLPYYETAAPLRALWHAWFSHQGLLPLHGACVGRDGAALLLTAPGGNGKSTTALLALQAGFDYLADDWCLLKPRAPAAHRLFGTAKLRPDNLHRFPGLADRIHNHDKLDEEKATFFLQRDFAPQLRSSARLHAIVVPRVTGRPETTFAPAGAALAWHALMGVTVRGIAGSGREAFALLGEVARCAPVFRLDLGTDLAGIPPVLEALLRHEPA
jgi:hypothetical protein